MKIRKSSLAWVVDEMGPGAGHLGKEEVLLCASRHEKFHPLPFGPDTQSLGLGKRFTGKGFTVGFHAEDRQAAWGVVKRGESQWCLVRTAIPHTRRPSGL